MILVAQVWRTLLKDLPSVFRPGGFRGVQDQSDGSLRDKEPRCSIIDTTSVMTIYPIAYCRRSFVSDTSTCLPESSSTCARWLTSRRQTHTLVTLRPIQDTISDQRRCRPNTTIINHWQFVLDWSDSNDPWSKRSASRTSYRPFGGGMFFSLEDALQPLGDPDVCDTGDAAIRYDSLQ